MLFQHIHLLPSLEFCLDNIVWLLNQIKTYNIQVPLSLINELEDKYWRLYSEIYVDSAKNELLPPSVYFQAWQLRGDDPKLYSDMELEAEQEASKISSTNHKELQKEIFLKSKSAKELYKNADLFSDAELQKAYNRLMLEGQQMRSIDILH